MDDVNSGGSALAIPHVLTDLKSLNGQRVVKSINGGYNTTCSVNIMAEVSSSDDNSIVDSEIYKLDNIIESREENNADIDNISQASTSKIANMDNCHSSSEPHDMVSGSNLSCNGNVNKSSISAESENDIDDPEINKSDDNDVCDDPSSCTDVAAADVNGIPDISEVEQTNTIKTNQTLSENCKPDCNDFSKEGNTNLSSGELKSDTEITINNAVEHDNCKHSQAQSTQDSGNGIVAIDEHISNPSESCKSSSAYGVGNKVDNSILDTCTAYGVGNKVENTILDTCTTYGVGNKVENSILDTCTTYGVGNKVENSILHVDTCTTKNNDAVSEDALVKNHPTVNSPFLIGAKVRSSLQGLVNKVNMLSNSTDTSVSSTCEQEKDKPKSSECEFQSGLHQDEPSPNLNDECCEENMDVIELDSSQDEKEQSEDNDDHLCDKVQTKLKQSVVDTRGDENKLGHETELENSANCGMLSVPVDSIKLKENSENLSTCNNDLTQQTKEVDDVLLASSIDDDTYMEIGSDNEEALLNEDTDGAITGSNETSHEKMDEKADDDVDGDIIFENEEKAVDNSSIETTDSHIPQNENKITRTPDQDSVSCEKEPSVDDEDDDVIFESETKADNKVTAISDMTNIIKTPITENPDEEKMEEDNIENKDVDDDDVIFESEEKGNGNINNKTSDTDSSQLKNKIDDENMEEDKIENKDVDDDDVIFESEEKGNGNINNKTSDTDSSQLKNKIDDENMEEDKIENKDVDDDDVIFESEEKGNVNINNKTSDTDSSQLKNKIDEDKMEEDKIENKDVDDDDVIFESEEKANGNINNKTSDTDSSQLKNKIDEEKMEEDKIENKDVDDDDVIFESEEKGNGNINNKTSDTDSSELKNKIINEDTNTSEKTKFKNNEKICKSDDSDDDCIFEGETKAPVSRTSHSAESLVTPEPIHNDDKETVKMALVKKEDGDNETTKSLTIDNKNNSSITSEDKEKPAIKESIHSAQSTKPPLDRKRPPSDTNDPTEKDAKRSRLDLVIGKLESAIGIAPDSVEVLDSGNDDEDDDTTDTTVAEKLGESASSEDEEKDDSEEDDSDDDEKKYIQITEPELDQLVREKVACYLITQRDTLIAQLQQKVKDLQISNDNWKAQVKDLQVKVNEVTVLQQKHEKRKAATAALRQITSRNVAVQVDDGKPGESGISSKPSLPSVSSLNVEIKHVEIIQTASSEKQIQRTVAKPPPPQKVISTPPRPAPTAQQHMITAPPGSGGTIRLPISQAAVPSVLTSQLNSPPGMMGLKSARNPSVKSLLDQTRQQPTAAGTPVSTAPVTPTSVNVIQYPQRFVTQNGTQGFILAPTPPNPATSIKSPPTKPVASVATTTLSSTAFKIIDLTADDDGNKAAQRLVSIPTSSVTPALRSTVPGTSATQIVFNPPMSTPLSTQLVRTTVPQQTAYQLVFNNSSPALRGTVAGISPMPQTVLAVPQHTHMQQTASVAATSLVTTARTYIPPVVSTSAVPVVPPSPVLQHPAPFPVFPNQKLAGFKNLPPKPSLKISRVSQGIVLSWNMSLNGTYADISNYQLFAYQETASAPSTLLWKKVGDVKALPLPMACTLTQFQVGNKYHFAVRAMDVHNRVGMFSDPSSIHLTPLVTK